MARPIFFLITLFLNIGTGNEPFPFSTPAAESTVQTLPAGTPAERGVWIARQIDERDKGRDGRTVMRMRLFDRQGRARERALVITSIEGGAGRPVPTDRTMIRFTEPADIRGTSFLVWDQPSGDDERFLYLPSLGRVRRIAGSEAQESFVGSDLTYEDIGGRELESYDYRLIDEQASWKATDGTAYPAYLLESRRKDATARFPRVESLVRKDNFVVVGARIFNRRDELQKTFEGSRVDRIGGYWTVMAMTMADLAARTRTDLVIEEARYNLGLGADDFSRRELERPLAAPRGTGLTPDAMSDAVAAFIYRRRWILTAFILVGAVVLAPRANITNIDNDLTAWFSRSDPIYQEYERFQREFGGTRNLIIALEAPSQTRLFSRDTFERLHEIGEDIARVRAVERVASLANATLVDALPSTAVTEDELLDVRALIDDLETRDPGEVGRRALADDLLRGDLISEDGTTTAIVVTFIEDQVDAVRAEVISEIKRIVEARAPPDFGRFYNGSLEISEEYNRVTLANQSTYTPPILILTLLALYLMFRSWRRTLLTMFAILVSLVWTLGLYSLLGFTYNVLSSMIVPLVVVLAVADDVHIVQHFDQARRRSGAREAFLSTVSHLMTPLFGASGTTALGMASLATSSVVAVREFGLGSAVGVMVDFVISIVLVPTLLSWLKPEAAPPPQESWFMGPLLAVGRFAVRRARLVALAAALVAVVSLAGLTKLRVDTNHINFFSPEHPLGQSARVIDTKLSGIYTFQILLDGEPDSMQRPDALRRMERLESDLRQLPFVRKVTGLADYVKRVHAEIGGGRAELPATPEVIAQELFVFTLADEGRREIERIAASDFSKAQVTVKLASMSSDVVFAQIQVAEGLAATAFTDSEIRTTVTGSGRLFATLDHYLVTSQISSFATAFVTVFAVIFAVFRSWRFGLLAVVPNLLPVLAIFGVMGWTGISLNIATIMLASVALGIVDDDTIHFISRYRRETRAGRGTTEAIEAAVAHEARASLTTAIINSLAFAVLALSSYKPTAWFGGLLALTMITAFLAELFILPATITLLPRLFGAERVHGGRQPENA